MNSLESCPRVELKGWARACLSSVLLLSSLSCAIPPGLEGQPLSDRAVTYNTAVAEAHERIVLLNVLRSAHRRPQQWSYIGTVRGSEGREASASVTFPFSGDAQASFNGTTAAKVSSSPGFDLNSLGDSEFLRGFMKPLDGEQVRYFVEQGWPIGFLLVVMTREIVEQKWESGPDGKDTWITVRALRNAPDKSENTLAEFCELAEELIREYHLDVVVVSKPPTIVSLPLEKLAALAEGSFKSMEVGRVVAFDKGEVTVELNEKPRVEFRFRRERPGGGPGRQASYGLAEYAQVDEQGAVDFDVFPGTADPDTAPTERNGRRTRRYLLIPRSTEGVVYYLGQLARAQEPLLAAGDMEGLARVVPWHWVRDRDEANGGRRVSTFVIGLGEAPCGAGYSSVRFDGRDYHVPTPEQTFGKDVTGGTSLMSMTLVHLLFGLHRKGQDFPSTPVVVAQ